MSMFNYAVFVEHYANVVLFICININSDIIVYAMILIGGDRCEPCLWEDEGPVGDRPRGALPVSG